MTDAETPQTVQAPAIKKDRSPSFPFIPLTRAVERARQLYAAARRHEMRLTDAAGAMGYGGKSSGAIQTLAALIAFGLVEDSGSGDARKFKISELGFKALEDERPGAREAALATAALTPKIIGEYAEHWKEGRPADAICISELRIERGFTEDGAKAFLRVFDDALAYAKVGDSDKKSDTGSKSGGVVEAPSQPPAVGDLVRVDAGGQTILEKVRVRAVQSLGGQVWVFVEGTEAGQKMEQVTIVEKAAQVDLPPPNLPLSRDSEGGVREGDEMDRFTVDEGVVKITFPLAMTTASVEELEQFFSLFIKKAKRRAGSGQKPN